MPGRPWDRRRQDTERPRPQELVLEIRIVGRRIGERMPPNAGSIRVLVNGTKYECAEQHIGDPSKSQDRRYRSFKAPDTDVTDGSMTSRPLTVLLIQGRRSREKTVSTPRNLDKPTFPTDGS